MGRMGDCDRCFEHELDEVAWRCLRCGKRAPFALRRVGEERYAGVWDWDLPLDGSDES